MLYAGCIGRRISNKVITVVANCTGDKGRGMSSDDPIDLAMVMERCLNDRGFVRELLEIFQKQAEAELPKLRDAGESGDMSQLCGLAHKLKGSAANVSAFSLNRLFTELEKVAREGPANRVAGLISEVESEIRRCGQFIAEIE